MAQTQHGRDQSGQDQKSNRGFTSMDDDKQRAIAAEGGRAAHAQGTAHDFDSEEAREAGRRGAQSRSSGTTDRDVQGVEAGGAGNRGQQAQGRERDEDGQFTSSDRDETSSASNDRSRGGSGRGE